MSGPLESSITLEEVLAVVSAKRVPLAPELAGYLALELCEGTGALPGEVDPRQVYIGDEGTVALVRQKRADAPTPERTSARRPEAEERSEGRSDDGEESVRDILQRLLDVSGSHTVALDAVAKRAPGTGIAALSQELESALVPVNRAAGRRAIARLAREVKRVTLGVGRNASLPPSERLGRGSQPSYAGIRTGAGADERPSGGVKRRPRDEVDSLLSAFEVEGGARSDALVSRDLKEIAGLTPTPAIAFPTSSRAGSQNAPAPTSASGAASERNPAVVTLSSSTTPPSPRSNRGLGRLETPSRRSGAGWLVVLVVAVLAAGAGLLIWILRADSRVRAPLAAPPVNPKGVEGTVANVRRSCKASVVITDAPAGAELLVHAGQAPVDVPRMPVGARLEFVATSDGYVPKRTVIPAHAAWDGGPAGKPRYEMAVGLERSHAKPGTPDPWPPGEPGSEVGGQGPPGTVHITSTPRGADIWLLTGLGPEATIDQLPCDTDVDILVAGPRTFRKRLHVAQSDFVDASPAAGRPLQNNTPAAPSSAQPAASAQPSTELLRKARISAK